MSELELAINLEESTNIEVLYQDEVYLDIDSSVVWIESGKTEIDKYVNDVAKPNIDKYVVTVVQPKLDAEVERAKGYADQAQATVDGFDAHAEEAKNNFDQHVATATNDFDVNALTLTARFDNNALAKTNEFNTNAQTMTDGYNQNAMLKIDDFDAHVAVKEMEFDDNASIKQALVDASAKKAKESELNAKTSEDNAKQSELNAKNSENASGISEDNARESERLARLSAESAKTSEDNAKISETNAKKYSENAKVSEDNAKVSETNSSTSETNASTSEQNAGNSATLAQTSERNAKASEEECKRILDSLSNIFVFKGTVPTYNDLPKTGNKAGDVWSTDDTQTYYAWDGTEWDNLGGLIDLSRLVNTDQDQEINASKTFLKDQAIKSPDLDIRNDRSKRGNGLIFTDKNGTQTAGIGVYINNNQSPECRFVASNGTKSAFAGLGVTTDGQGFFEIPEPSDTSDNNDAVSSRWVNKKVNTKQDKLSTAQITATNSGITAAKVATYDGYNATINGKQAQLNAAQLKAVNSGIDNVKVTKYDGYEKTINSKQQALNSTQLNAVNSGITLAKVSTYDGYKALIDGKQPTGNYQTVGNLSQTLDASASKYPSNKAVATAIANIDALPTQTGQAGKFLSTDGTSAKWDTVDLSSKANTSLDNLSEAGEKHFLGNRNISNCITEIPQDIKLELNNGTLTLKAGSKVYVPNGVGKFDEVITQSDLSIGGFNDFTCVIFYRRGALYRRQLDLMYSGETNPNKQYIAWYDTKNNKISFAENVAGTYNTTDYSLPIAIATSKNKVWSSIDQVFNGFGYIGSTVYALPNVKGLIPDGRNADGSLKSVELINDSVKIFNESSVFAHIAQIGLKSSMMWTSKDVSYHLDINRIVNDVNLNKEDVILIGECFYNSSGRITSFNPKQPFQALDYNNKPEITSWGFPSDKFIDLGRPASQTPLTAPANGYYSVDGKQTSQSGFFRIDNVTAKLSTKSQNSFSDTDQCCYMKAKKGQQIKITYFNINVKSCYFVYAEGDK